MLLPASAFAHQGHLFKLSFGSSGSAAGRLSLTEPSRYPESGSGLAVSQATGDVYVADTGNHRVDEFAEDGTFIRAWGWGVSTGASVLQVCTSTCRQGLSGSAPGEFEQPVFIAVDNSTEPSDTSKGDVYVGDAGDDTVAKFDPEGNLISSWGTGGQIREVPTSAAATGSGDIASGSATGTGDLKAAIGEGQLTSGSTTVEDLQTSGRGPFLLGMAISGEGIPQKTTITAVGSGSLTLSNPATITKANVYLKAGSMTVENVTTSTGAFAVGQGIESEGGISSSTYITAVGSGTLTLSQPAEGSASGAALHTNTMAVTNLTTSTGAFELGQAISGAGIPAGTEVRAVGSGFLFLNKNATVGGTGVSLSARFSSFGEFLAGIAVDFSGDLWLRGGLNGGNGQVFEFAPGGAFVTTWHSPIGRSGIAIDPADDLYMVTSIDVSKFTSAGVDIGAVENGESHGESITGLAVDPASGDLYVDADQGSEVRHFPPSCEPAAGVEPATGFCTPADAFGAGEEPPAGRLSEGQGLAVGPGHLVYAADASDSKVLAYRQATFPDVTTGAASELAQTTVTLHGTVNPDGVELTECLFEYGETTAYGQTAPCAETPAQIGTGHSPVQVEADLTGLAPSFYHYRLIARNAEPTTSRGADATFGASIDSSLIQSAGFTEATLAAQINPHGTAASCQLQYITEAQFEADQPEGFAHATTIPCEPEALGSGSADQAAIVQLTGLAPATNYRFRFLAIAAAHSTDGPTEDLYTYSLAPASSGCSNEGLREENDSTALPDCRAYERVSPAGNAEVFQPLSSPLGAGDIEKLNIPMQASSTGDAVAYAGEPPSSGVGSGTGNKGSGVGDEYLAVRSEAGWNSDDISPLGGSSFTNYEAFSPDLSRGIIVTESEGERPLSAGVETSCDLLYSRATTTGVFTPAFTTEPTPCATQTRSDGEVEPGRPIFVGASANGLHLLFESPAALVAGAKKVTGEWGHDNVYDSAAGQLHLVNVLPGAQHKSVPNATVGGLSSEKPYAVTGSSIPPVSASNVVSADGSRVFWTDLENETLYVRENDDQEPSVESSGHCTEPEKACTVQVSAGPATYQTATPDGRYAYYIEAGDLWRFDTQTEAREALAGGSGAEVQGVVGVNERGEDGSYLYFVAAGKLSSEAEARKCKAASPNGSSQEKSEAAEEASGAVPPGRGCNLYLLHGGQASLVAVLLPGDDEFAEFGSGSSGPIRGDWRPILGYRSAQLSPDGSHLVFMSERRLTSYDSVNLKGGCDATNAGHPASCAEIYVYDASAAGGEGELSCVSCDPAGVSPVGLEDARGANTYLPGDFGGGATHASRSISASGDRVFFTTDQPLLPADDNSERDVYEWERRGAGSCAGGSALDGGGCLYLLSAGKPGGYSALIDTDEEGENAFFITRSGLIPTDRDEKSDLYDARAGGGFPVGPGGEVEAPPCESAEACKPPPGEHPVESFPASAAFSGPGNLVSPPEVVKPPLKKIVKKTVKCKKNFVKDKQGKCVRKKTKKKKAKTKKAKRAGNDRRAK